MIRNIESAITVTRILADNGLGGRQLERAAGQIVALFPTDEPLQEWERDLLDPNYRVKEWCRLNLPSYRDEASGSYRKIAMIKDCRVAFGIGLKEAKDFVDEAVTNSDLAVLRQRLTGN